MSFEGTAGPIQDTEYAGQLTADTAADLEERVKMARRREGKEMGSMGEVRPLRYSINVTLDGCCDHRVMIPDEDLHRHATETLDRADALLFGRVTYEMGTSQESVHVRSL